MSTDPDRQRRWWLAPILGAVVVVAAVGGLVARNFYQQQPVVNEDLTLGGASGQTSAPATAQDSQTVKITSDVAKSPQQSSVQTVLQTYFDAINNKDYQGWRRVVTPNRAAEQSQATWEKGYKSTKDSDIVVYRVDTAPANGLRVLLAFHSVQDPADAPPDFPHACIQWQVVWPLTWNPTARSYELDAGSTGTTPVRQAC